MIRPMFDHVSPLETSSSYEYDIERKCHGGTNEDIAYRSRLEH